MLHPTFSFNTKVFYQFTHDTHRVSHSPLSQEVLRQFHPSSYKIMDWHQTSLGASTANHGRQRFHLQLLNHPSVPLVFSILPLLCHCPHHHCRWQGCVTKATVLLTTLCFQPRVVGLCCFNPPLPLLWTQPPWAPHPLPHPHYLSPQCWCLVHLPHFNLIKVDL